METILERLTASGSVVRIEGDAVALRFLATGHFGPSFVLGVAAALAAMNKPRASKALLDKLATFEWPKEPDIVEFVVGV